MANPIVEQLRRSIDAKHAEALRALEMLAGYLNEPVALGNGTPDIPKKHAPRAGTGKIRNAVLAAFRQDFLSVEAAAKQTGRTPSQVRGVLSAPSLKNSFAKKEIDAVMHYKLEGDPQT